MQYKTHLAVSLAVGIPLMSCAGDLNFPNAMALCAGTLLPDIDHPGSYMGKRIKFISKVANKTLGHRGGTHSLLFAGLVYAFSYGSEIFISLKLPTLFLFGFYAGICCICQRTAFQKRGQLALATDETQGKIRWQVCILQYWKAERGLDFSGSGCVVLLELKLAYDGNLKSLTPGRTGEFLKYSIEFLKRVLCLKT